MSEETEERFVITSCRSEERAKIISKYLNDEFRLASDYPTTVEENVNKKHKYYGAWVVTIDPYQSRYGVTIEKMRNGCSDFWKGYDYRMKEVDDKIAGGGE